MKRYPFLLLFILILTVSCKETISEQKVIAEEVSLAPNTISRTLARQQQYSELPDLAHFINELVFWEDEVFEDPAERLKLETNRVVFAEEYETELDTFASNFARFTGGWSGTSGIKEWITTYSLLNNDSEPIVLVTRYSTESYRSYESYIEHRQEIEDQLTDQNIEENKITDIAEKMLERSTMQNTMSLSGEYLDATKISYWAWKKKNDQWINISENVFSSDMVEDLNTHFPFFEADFDASSKQKGFYLAEKEYPKHILQANSKNWLTWFGIKKLKELDLKVKLEGDDILLNCSKNKSIRWQWNGVNFDLKNLPGKVKWLTNPCPSIDFNTGGDYKFKGTIGDKHDIEMQINISSKDKKLNMTGEYWHLNQPDSKFPIKGELYKDAAKQVTFHTLKSGKKREVFNCYFSNCGLEGWWQHLGNMDINKFELKLVQ
jgi:hypothetical protein